MSEICAIIDYGSGNLHSARKAFEHVIAAARCDIKVIVTDKADIVAGADRIVLPGQGAFGDCMDNLQAVDGMIDALNESVLQKGTPFFGICVGMQLLADEGLEHGRHNGLGWIPGAVIPMQPSDPVLKIPHMGWNDCTLTETGSQSPMLQSITKKAVKDDIHFYFVHSFMFQCKDTKHVLATADYGGTVPAIIGRDNILGAQFHPEKSQEDGLALIHDFVRWTAD